MFEGQRFAIFAMFICVVHLEHIVIWTHEFEVCYNLYCQYLAFLVKGLVTPRDHGFFSSKNHVIEEILKFCFCQYLLF